MYSERLQNVSVLGAAGKMGSGILLLTAVEMADLSFKPENKDITYVLNAIDVSPKALNGLMEYLKVQVKKIAEKKTVQLRKLYEHRADLIENEEMINQYISDVLAIVHPVTRLEAAYDSYLIFEAVNEDENLKVKLFSQIDNNNPHTPWFFTNTSSVPIYIIDNKAQLSGRILGFHFYNPPAIQKLAELITTSQNSPEIIDFAKTFAKNLRKVIVPSNDIAGFIGNGHFMRDILYAVSEVEHLTKNMTFAEAVYCMNKISQDFLIRPMGIFQLMDYVGIDVCQFIMKVMAPHIKDEKIHCDLLDTLMSLQVKGGQNSDGSQKNGILKYEKNKPVAVYDVNVKDYVAITTFQANCDEKLGKLPDGHLPWKNAVNLKNKHEVFSKYFNNIKSMQTLGSKLALYYAQKSKAIGLKLVSDGVAHNNDDVNTVMLTGFFHAYGPINEYV